MADPASARPDEERLAQALIGRGLLTREEWQGCKAAADAAAGPEALLARLQAAGLLTAGQARRAAQELTALLGQKIPGYALLEKVGQGSMGVVFKARQLSMNRVVALKVLHPRLGSNAELLERMRREAHLAAKLSHNNIVQAIDFGSAGSVHYFVMEYVEGKTIRQELDAGKVFAEGEAVEIVLQAAQALEHAGRRGLVHRDVKPANLVLTAEGVVKLADLGMARQARDPQADRRERGLAVGTPYYMAPEQIEGRQDVDIRADLYALGATLYHMTTGQPPFPSKDVDEILRAHLEEELTPPDHINQGLSAGLGEVVEVLMAKDRERRYRSPADLIVDLECLLNGEPPRLARRQVEAEALRGLAEGADEDEDEGAPPPRPAPQAAWLWVALLGGLLGLSVLVNLVLLLRR
jgi:serine/threonine-protein kinase